MNPAAIESTAEAPSTTHARRLLGFSGPQWAALASAWLGWGFDFFDVLLFNAVTPNCIASLLHLPMGSLAAKQATVWWGTALTSVLLLGWAAGGILFGWLTDRIGRVRTLAWTITIYSAGTALCAFAPNIYVLLVFRIVASLGIGGEWAAGAALVAEVVPERRRAEAGALLFTASPIGMLMASAVNHTISTVWLRQAPEVAWRYVLLTGLLPVALAAIVRRFVRESEDWKHASREGAPPQVKELFSPALRRRTWSGVLVASAAAITWWTVSALIPVVSTHLAQAEAGRRALDAVATNVLSEEWKAHATTMFSMGGLLGTILCVLPAKALGRRAMYALYFALAAAAMLSAFGFSFSPETRMNLYFPIGLGVFGVAGSFTFYLPELFPTRLRGTGAGFCFNICRVIASAGPVLVGTIASRGSDTLASSFRALLWLGLVPLVACLLTPFIVETRERTQAGPLPSRLRRSGRSYGESSS
jgi:MFS family permease